MKILKYTAYILTLIGALNWGLVGIFGFDLVAFVFGEMTLLARFVYALVGISAIVAGMYMYHCDRTVSDSCEYGSCHL